MPRVAAILGFSAVLLLFCGYLPSASAQTAGPKVATKFDSFGKVGHCDLTARLDNLAISVQQSRGAKAHIIFYGPPGTEERILAFMKDYLVMTRGLLATRINTTYGGRNSDLKLPKTELWIVPRNALSPEPQKLDNTVETFKGLFDDDRASDYVNLVFEDEMGPGVGPTTHPSFADMLNQQNDAAGYVVVYSGEDAAPGAWRRIAQDEIDYLKNFKVDPARVKMIFGGHQKQTRRQLWILPKDAPPPVPDAGPELPLARTIKVDDFYAEQLSDPQNQTNLFTHLNDILTAQKSVRAFLVVRMEVPSPDEASVVDEPELPGEPESSSSETFEELETADLVKMVEKWRVELANTHKIGADRFIVLFTTAPEEHASHLRLWIVPEGQPLPDPNEEERQPEPK